MSEFDNSKVIWLKVFAVKSDNINVHDANFPV